MSTRYRGPSRYSRQGRRRPRDVELRVHTFVSAYLKAAALFGFCLSIAPVLSVFLYFGCGLALSRFVSRRMEEGPVTWNWHLASIADIVRVKLTMVVWWPIAMPHLVWQLAVYKHL